MQTLSVYDKSIANHIIQAQISSDGGKRKKTFLTNKVKKGNLYKNKGYNVKDSQIIKSIHNILKSKNSIFRFYVKKDTKKITNSCIVYFNFQLDGENYQVSFHSFSNKMLKYVNNKNITRWKKKYTSNQSCIQLLTYL